MVKGLECLAENFIICLVGNRAQWKVFGLESDRTTSTSSLSGSGVRND